MSTIKFPLRVAVTASLPVIGLLNPYRYSVVPKKLTAEAPKRVEFAGAAFPSYLTKGKGKGSDTRYYAYFLDDSELSWIELTASTYAAIERGEVLRLAPVLADADPTLAETPARVEFVAALAAEPAAETPKAKRAKRETANA